MKNELNSEGECLYCNKLFSQKQIGKHLAKHLADNEKADTGDKTHNFCHVEVKAGEYFLHLLVRGETTMKKIDQFLRDI